MARVTVFAFRSGKTLLHRLDPRFKLLFMIMLSLGTIDAGYQELALITMILIFMLANGGIHLSAAAKELKIFPWFLLFIFMARSVTTEGQEIFRIYSIAPTVEGCLQGLRICWRLIIVILVSLAFITSTTTAQIKAAIEFYFAKVPCIDEKRLSTMLGLLVRFIPVILTQFQETMDAQRARCIEMKKSPLYRITKLTVPALRRVFRRGDYLAIAMASRCYSENRTGAELTSTALDWTALVILLTFLLLIRL